MDVVSVELLLSRNLVKQGQITFAPLREKI